MPKKNVPIKYTSREFESIRNDLIDYVKRYYPDTYKDFNEASFGSLMLDTVAYVGDILSFYVDYQANESFLATALEYNNIIKLGRQIGFRHNQNPVSTGLVSVYLLIPACSAGAPDTDYMPILRRGTKFTAVNGNIYSLSENVSFSDPTNEVVVAKVNDAAAGAPSHFAVKASGKVVSGAFYQENVEIGPHQRFRRIELTRNDISEVVSIFDSEGHEYYEVDYLSQDIVYREILNTGTDKTTAPSILKVYRVPRRYMVEFEGNRTFVQFGHGSDSELDREGLTHPDQVVMVRHARDHIKDVTFDPFQLTENDKFGVSPSNTTLFITYRSNQSQNVNTATNTVNVVSAPILVYPADKVLDPDKTNAVTQSLEVTNESPIVGDVSIPHTDELKKRIGYSFASQNRAVTKQDYESLVYRMPAQFGAIKRCAISQDSDSFKRNLNLYVISENADGTLVETNNTIKENLKLWLTQYKMINDTIDILGGKIVNLGIEFVIVGNVNYDKFDVLNNCINTLTNFASTMRDMGEPISISDIYRRLNATVGVTDTLEVNIVNKLGGLYSDLIYDIPLNTTADGRYVLASRDIIFEFKYPTVDIKGVVK